MQIRVSNFAFDYFHIRTSFRVEVVLQPFPRAFGKTSEKRGGNAMGLSKTDHDRFVLEIAGVYSKKEDDELMQAWGR
jgi:hypothetical protein